MHCLISKDNWIGTCKGILHQNTAKNYLPKTGITKTFSVTLILGLLALALNPADFVNEMHGAGVLTVVIVGAGPILVITSCALAHNVGNSKRRRSHGVIGIFELIVVRLVPRSQTLTLPVFLVRVSRVQGELTTVPCARYTFKFLLLPFEAAVCALLNVTSHRRL